MKRDFKGVWIPKDIWLAKNLSWTEKLVLTELDSLDNDDGCFATNEYLGTFFGLSKGRISKIISKLAKEKYIKVTLIYKNNRKEIDKRVIEILPRVKSESIYISVEEGEQGYSQKQLGGIVENDHRYSQKQLEGIVEFNHTPIVENDQDNNTIYNNTINNTININIYSEIIEYLNSKANTKYRVNNKKTRASINARITEGFAIDDFKKVIDIKSAEWLNTNMQQYLRPETLFGTKFEGYLNQKITKQTGNYTSNNSKRHKENTNSSYNHNDIESEILKFQEGL